jgi:hypothetical protein
MDPFMILFHRTSFGDLSGTAPSNTPEDTISSTSVTWNWKYEWVGWIFKSITSLLK